MGQWSGLVPMPDPIADMQEAVQQLKVSPHLFLVRNSPEVCVCNEGGEWGGTADYFSVLVRLKVLEDSIMFNSPYQPYGRYGVQRLLNEDVPLNQ